MNFFDNYYTVGTKVKSKAARQEYYTAIIEYYYTGEEPSFKSEAAEIAFAGVRFSLEKSRRNSNNRRKTKPERNANETRTKPKPNENESGAGEEIERLSSREEEEEVLEEESTPLYPPDDFDFDDGPTPYAWQCLDAFNEAMGTSYTSMPSKCGRTLARFEGTYPVGDVAAMIAFKRDEWTGTRFANCLTPNTLFSPDHFEQYMNQSRSSAAESRDYERYD